jgi:hypothetical protein
VPRPAMPGIFSENVSFPDLTLLFRQIPPDEDPYPSTSQPRVTRLQALPQWPGSFRHSDILIRFFEQFPVRRVEPANGSQHFGELKWSEARRIALARDLYTCRRCESRDRELLTVHHIFPRALGGGNNPGNLVTLCETCHQALCRYCSRPTDLRVSPGKSAFMVPATRETMKNCENDVFSAFPAGRSCRA